MSAMLRAALLTAALCAASADPGELKRTFSVPESAPPNTLLGFLRDPPPPPGGGERYLIVFPPETEVEESLAVDSSNGEIRIRRALDYERRSSLVFLAIPVDGSAGIRVEVNVLDENDNAPVFPVPSVSVHLSEYAKLGSETPLPSATDADSGNFSVQHYRIVAGNVNNAFRLSTKRLANVLYLDLIVNAELDREFRTAYQLDVEALDGGSPPKTAALRLNISVVDANDNPPVFAQPRYLAQVLENATVGQQVIQVGASDADEGANAQVEFRLVPSPANAHTFFALDKDSGLLTLRKPLPSISGPRQYEVLVVARDKGLQPLEATAFVTVSVLSASQYLPAISVIYLSPEGRAEVSESARAGDFVARLSVRDPETGEEYRRPVNLSIVERRGPFALQQTRDAVYILSLAKRVDREATPTLGLSLVAVDNSGRVGRRNLTLIVGDINDNAPEFTSGVYEAEVEERTGVGASVIQVRAVDPDAGRNGTVVYALEAGPEQAGWFSIDPTTGLITTRQGIDCEVSSSPTLTVIASDLGPIPRTASAKVMLRILDVNDNPPIFSKTIYNVSLGEDTEVGSCFLKVSASDPDCGLNAAVSFRIEEEVAAFRLDERTGTLCLQASLDYETTASFQFHVFATDGGGLSSSAVVRVGVEDRDDNAPTFYPALYNVSVASEAGPGLPLLLVSATDADSGDFGRIRYSLLNPEGPFRLDADRGELYVDGGLSAGHSYRLSVGAVDGGGLSSISPAVVNVNVLRPGRDAAPQFHQKLYRFSVREDTLPGIEIGSVEASGPGRVRYSIYSGDPDGQFGMDAESGALTVREYLDADARQSLLLNVQAALGDPPVFNHTQVRIELEDVNDNGPIFERSRLRTSVSEDQATDAPFYVVAATDADRGPNGQITYRIAESNPPGPFLLRPHSGQLFVVSPLDFEEQTAYELTISATDGGVPAKSTSLTLSITVMDANDHAPKFPRIVYEGEVREDAEILTRVTQVTATDADSGHNAQISYSLGPPHDIDGQFGILADSGWVYVRKQLDRELVSAYNLQIMAKDHGNPALSSSTRLRIQVGDINDNSPTCGDETPELVVEENSPPRTFVARLFGEDADAGENATLVYELKTHLQLFFLEPTGELYTRGPMDAEVRSSYNLGVELRDEGRPSRSSTCSFRVRLSDTNDNSPFFVLPYQDKIQIREEGPTGSEVVQVRATDPDAGQNGSITYSLLDTGAFALFRIHPQSGVLTVHRRLDFEALPEPLLRLSIQAADHGKPPKKSVKELLVQVVDVPGDDAGTTGVDGGTQVRFQVSETSPVGTEVGAVEPARAAHFGPQTAIRPESLDILFEISGGNSQELFDIDRVSSRLYLIKPLDFEAASLHSLVISRIDQSGPGLPVVSSVTAQIEVGDENDNAPVFLEDPIISTLAEDAAVGQLVWKFEARDSDAGANGRIVYGIVEQSPEAAFTLDPVTGELWVESSLDAERHSEYLVVIQAEDQAPLRSARNTARVTARIYITDVNDNAPAFVSRERVDVFEDEPAGHPLLHVLAADADSLDNARLSYRILEGDEAGRFRLNETSGALSLARRLERDSETRHFMLRILATDAGRPPLSATQLLDVYVQDVNSNGPRFTHSVFAAQIGENQPPNSFVAQIEAQAAPGSSVQGKLVYSMPSGQPPVRFKIDKDTGKIVTTTILDRERKSRYILTVYVRAEGGGWEYDAGTVVVDVVDENDSAPKLSPAACPSISLPENQAFPALHSIIASDADAGQNGRLVYAITGGNVDGKFSIDPSSGQLSCQALDRETVDAYTLNIVVRDSGSPALSDECRIGISVLDVNDEAPLFSEAEYSTEVGEDLPLGSTLLTVAAADADLPGRNSELTFSLRDHPEAVFLIHPQSGAVQSIAGLDFETQSLYSLTVVARDAGATTALESTARLLVSVRDLNDHAPTFAEVPFVANVSTHTPRGQRIVRVVASDSDGPGPNSQLDYRFTQNHDEFSINPKTGVISARDDLFFKAGSIYYLEVEAKDSGSPPRATLGMVEIRVGWIGGESELLRFPEAGFRATIGEDAAVGTFVHRCAATRRARPVSPAAAHYRIVAGDPQGTFAVDQDTGNIVVAKAGQLDRETEPVYRLVIEGREGAEHAFASLIVEVQDANDHVPQFLQQRYASAVWEGRPRGQFVMQVSAVDRDSGENAHITYSIVSGNQDAAFVVDGTGKVSTGVELDREVKDRYHLTLTATDAGRPPKSSQTLLEIQVIDVNDNSPSFPPPRSVTLSEAATVGTVIGVVSANDVDQEPVLEYSFGLGGNPGGLFAIDPFSARLSLARALDYEAGHKHLLSIQASDRIHTAVTSLEVVLVDENDNAPEFSQGFYQVSLPEDTPVGASILQLDATDSDSGEGGRLRYSLTGEVPTTPGGSSPAFWIHPSTGALHSNLSLGGGAFRGRLLSLGVTVEDGGEPIRSAFASVQIQILSRAIEGQPRFAQPEYRFKIREDAAPHTPVGSVGVVDAERFLGLVYAIRGGNSERVFRLDAAGQLTLARHLDRESIDEYRLDLSVSMKSNSVANSTASVVVEVEDVNDNAPIFAEKEAMARLGESAEIGSTLISLSATDADEGANGAVSFEITSGNELSLFAMDGRSGVISVARRLSAGQFRLIVKAKDGGDPPRSSIATIQVAVADENDNGPFFAVPLLLGRIPENAPPGHLVFTAKATDRDGSDYGRLSYELRDSPGPGHGSARGLFKINPVSGEVRTLVPFDYEARDTYYFLVEAVDKGGKTASVPGQVLIRGLDEFAPQFSQESYAFDVSYEAALGSKVGVIYATDADAGVDGIISYRFEEPSEYFAINSASGVVSVTKTLGPLATESPLGLKQDKGKLRKRAVVTPDPFAGSETEPLVRIMFLSVIAESGTGSGRRNRSSVEIKLGHFGAGTAGATTIDSRTITIISIVLIVLLILILLFVALKLRRKKMKDSPTAQKKIVPRVHHSAQKTSNGQRPPFNHQGPYSRPPAVRVSAFGTGEPIYGEAATESEYQRPNAVPARQPQQTSASNVSNRSSGRGSVILEEEEGGSSGGSDRSAWRHQVRSGVDSGIHVFPDDAASLASDLPSAQDYLTSLGVTAPLPDNRHDIHMVVAQGRLDYAESQTDDGVDVQELIYSKVSEVLAEDGDANGNGRLLPDANPAALRTFYPARKVGERGAAAATPAPGPSYQPLTHVFSEISKLKTEAEGGKGRRGPAPAPPTRLHFAPPPPPLGSTQSPSPNSGWMAHYASPDEPPPPPPPLPVSTSAGGPPVGVARRFSRNSASGSEREIKI